jgi:hypothetical protein
MTTFQQYYDISLYYRPRLMAYSSIMFHDKRHNRLITPWIITGIYLLVIYLTLPLAPLLVQGLFDRIGYDYFSDLTNAVLLMAAVFFLLRIIKNRLENGLLALPPLFLTVWVASQMERAVERLHFLEYGLLGILVYWAAGYPTGFRLLWIFLAVTAAGGLDELIQYFLPNRYGDMRDIWFNALGGGLGLWLGVLLKYRPGVQDIQ